MQTWVMTALGLLFAFSAHASEPGNSEDIVFETSDTALPIPAATLSRPQANPAWAVEIKTAKESRYYGFPEGVVIPESVAVNPRHQRLHFARASEPTQHPVTRSAWIILAQPTGQSELDTPLGPFCFLRADQGALRIVGYLPQAPEVNVISFEAQNIWEAIAYHLTKDRHQCPFGSLFLMLDRSAL